MPHPLSGNVWLMLEFPTPTLPNKVTFEVEEFQFLMFEIHSIMQVNKVNFKKKALLTRYTTYKCKLSNEILPSLKAYWQLVE